MRGCAIPYSLLGLAIDVWTRRRLSGALCVEGPHPGLRVLGETAVCLVADRVLSALELINRPHITPPILRSLILSPLLRVGLGRHQARCFWSRYVEFEYVRRRSVHPPALSQMWPQRSACTREQPYRADGEVPEVQTFVVD